MSLGPFELLVVIAVLLLAVGPAVLPRLMRNVGRNVGAFKKGMRDADVRREIAGVLQREEGAERDRDRDDRQPATSHRPREGEE